MVLTNMSRVMVEGFLNEYLYVDEVVGGKFQVVGGSYYINFISNYMFSQKHEVLKDLFREIKALLSSS